MVLSRHERSPAENSCSTGKGLDIGSNSRRAGGHQECSREVERWRPNALESQVNPGAPGSIAPTTTYSKETALQQPSLMRHRIMPPQRKREALTVTRLIHEVLVGQLSIPLRQIVNDTTFQKYTGSKRPDSSGPHHQDSGEAKIRESTAGVSRKPSSDCKACGCSSKHLCGLTAWNT